MKKKRLQIPESLINAITGKLAVAFISAVTTFAVSFITWAFEPVRELIELPNRFDKVELKVSELSDTYNKGLVTTTTSDSTIKLSVNLIGDHLVKTDQNVRVIEIKIDAIGEEFPALHKRFDDIEKSVTSINRKITFNTNIKANKVN